MYGDDAFEDGASDAGVPESVGSGGTDVLRARFDRARAAVKPGIARLLRDEGDACPVGDAGADGGSAERRDARAAQVAHVVVSNLVLARRRGAPGGRTAPPDPPPADDEGEGESESEGGDVRAFYRRALDAARRAHGVDAGVADGSVADAAFADPDARRAAADLWSAVGRAGSDGREVRLESGFEGLVAPGPRRRWGRVYTPPDVAAMVARWAVRDPADVVIDPACGTGRFLTAAARRLDEVVGTAEASAGDGRGGAVTSGSRPLDRVYGVELDSVSASLAAASLAGRPDAARGATPNVAVGDFFDARPGGEPSDGGVGLPAAADAVVMNPPYTRREGLDGDYAAAVREAALSGFDDPPSVGQSAGYYAYFLLHAAKFLRDGGRLGAVVPTSWLDADYGAGLQEFLLDEFRIEAVVDPGSDCLVRTADVNAVVLLLERESDPAARADNRAKFVTLRRPVEAFAADEGGDGARDAPAAADEVRPRAFGRLFERLADAADVRDDDLRVLSRRQSDLRAAGEGATTYTGGKWGRTLRAPDAYWEVRERRGDRLVTFEELAAEGRGSLSYGTRSGAPDFFYLPNDHHDAEPDGDTLRLVDGDGDVAFELPREYWMHRAGEGPAADAGDRPDGGGGGDPGDPADGGEWVPNYLLKRSRGIDRLRFSVEELSPGGDLRYVLRFDAPRADLHPEARAYVEWGESHDVEACDRCRRSQPLPAHCAGDRWYDVTPHLTAGQVLPNKDIHARHAYWTPDAPVWVHQSLYGVAFDGDADVVSGLLNSTLGLLMLEVAGRVNLGEGALDLMTSDHRSVAFPDPDRLAPTTRRTVASRFREMADRPVGTVFAELGADAPDEWSMASVRTDRRTLDRAVMGDALDLPRSTQAGVYRGLLELVRGRLDRAASGDGA